MEKSRNPRPASISSSGISLFRIKGIQIRIDFSWFIVFFLLIWSLSAGYFPMKFPHRPPGAYWLAGTSATILFFVSVLIHELSHSLVALRTGISIPSITLFIFGGVSELSEDAKSPGNELKIAIAGPLSSFVLAGVFWGLMYLASQTPYLMMAAALQYLAWINMALAIFNLFPGFPLDGGRVLRAIWWKRKGSLTAATRVASQIGRVFAVGLIFLGILQLFHGFLLGGLWFIFIGIFLRSAASGSYRELILRKTLQEMRIKDAMIDNVLTVPVDLPVSGLIHDYIIRHGYKGFPVTDGGRVVGIVSVSDIRGLSETERKEKKVGEIMSPLGKEGEISPDTLLIDALNRMNAKGYARLLVFDGERFSGMITKTGVMRLLEIKNILGAD